MRQIQPFALFIRIPAMDYLKHQQQIEGRLWSAASVTATGAGFPIDEQCEWQLREEIRLAAIRMLGSGLVLDPLAVGRAYGGTVTLVHGMIEAVAERERSVLDQESLSEALRRLCPLFPFC